MRNKNNPTINLSAIIESSWLFIVKSNNQKKKKIHISILEINDNQLK